MKNNFFVCSVFIALLLLLSGHVFAASGGEIPFSVIIPQIVNFTLIILLLVYLTRNTVKNHFKSKSEKYLELVNRAQIAKEEAQTKYNETKAKLNELQATAQANLERIKAEAEELKGKIILGAQQTAARQEEEAGKTAVLELEKAKTLLRIELLNKSFEQAEGSLKKNIDGPVHKRLQSEFVEKIQVGQ